VVPSWTPKRSAGIRSPRFILDVTPKRSAGLRSPRFILGATPKLKFGLRSPRFILGATPKLKFGLRSPRFILGAKIFPQLDAERPGMHSHARRGNEKKIESIKKKMLYSIKLSYKIRQFQINLPSSFKNAFTILNKKL